MPNADMMASLPYALLAVGGLIAAVLVALIESAGRRRSHVFLGIGIVVLLSLWFGMLTVSAGPTPIVRRGDLATVMRVLAALIAALLFGWLALYLKRRVHIG